MSTKRPNELSIEFRLSTSTVFLSRSEREARKGDDDLATGRGAGCVVLWIVFKRYKLTNKHVLCGTKLEVE
jgi:hypothetical protein